MGLYRDMPGAPRPAQEHGLADWSSVEGNKHWQFCESIVALVEGVVADERSHK